MQRRLFFLSPGQVWRACKKFKRDKDELVTSEFVDAAQRWSGNPLDASGLFQFG
jgi:hypothetical protein